MANAEQIPVVFAPEEVSGMSVSPDNNSDTEKQFEMGAVWKNGDDKVRIIGETMIENYIHKDGKTEQKTIPFNSVAEMKQHLQDLQGQGYVYSHIRNTNPTVAANVIQLEFGKPSESRLEDLDNTIDDEITSVFSSVTAEGTAIVGVWQEVQNFLAVSGLKSTEKRLEELEGFKERMLRVVDEADKLQKNREADLKASLEGLQSCLQEMREFRAEINKSYEALQASAGSDTSSSSGEGMGSSAPDKKKKKPRSKKGSGGGDGTEPPDDQNAAVAGSSINDAAQAVLLAAKEKAIPTPVEIEKPDAEKQTERKMKLEEVLDELRGEVLEIINDIKTPSDYVAFRKGMSEKPAREEGRAPIRHFIRLGTIKDLAGMKKEEELDVDQKRQIKELEENLEQATRAKRDQIIAEDLDSQYNRELAKIAAAEDLEAIEKLTAEWLKVPNVTSTWKDVIIGLDKMERDIVMGEYEGCSAKLSEVLREKKEQLREKAGIEEEQVWHEQNQAWRKECTEALATFLTEGGEGARERVNTFRAAVDGERQELGAKIHEMMGSISKTQKSALWRLWDDRILPGIRKLFVEDLEGNSGIDRAKGEKIADGILLGREEELQKKNKR